MSGVRVLAGTRKGAFILTSDAKRKEWKVDGPHFAGWEIYHMKGSPADPNRIYASQTSAPTPCPRDAAGGNIPCTVLSAPQPAGVSAAAHSAEFMASLPLR